MPSTTSSSGSSSTPLLPNTDGTTSGVVVLPQSALKLTSLWLIVALMFLYGSELVIMLLFQLLQNLDAQMLYTFTNFSNILLFLITILFTSIIHYDLQRLRRRGYVAFHSNFDRLLSAPVIIFSLGNAALLTYSVILSELGVRMGVREAPKGGDVGRTDVSRGSHTLLIGLQVVVVVEVLVSLVFLFLLAAKVLRFNSCRRPPDILDDDFMSRGDDDVIDVAVSSEGAREDVLTEVLHERLDFLKRRCVLLTRRLRHVLTNLPSSLKAPSEKSLRNFFEKHHDDDGGDDGGDVAGREEDDDMIVA